MLFRSITVAFGIANILIQNGCVRKVITTMPRMKFGRSNMTNVPLAKNLLKDQNIEVELVNQVTIVERLRASASGIGAFYTPVGVGTELAEGKETKLINGVPHVLEYAIRPDFAICRVNTADLLGNVKYEQMFKNVNHEFISAGKVSIVQADQITEPGTFDPDTTGCFVNRLLKTKNKHTVFKIGRAHV